MKKNKHEDLLKDVLLDEEFRGMEAETCRRALGALGERRRKRILLKSVTGTLALVAIITVSATLLDRMEQKAEKEQAVAPQKAPTSEGGIEALTDEELLRSFPPGSCALAEVNGRKVLVFRSEEMRERFLH